MQGNEVRVLEQVFQAVRLAHLRGQTPRRLDGDLRIETDDFHAEADRRIRHQAPDCTQPDNAQCASGQFGAGEFLFAVLHLFVQGRIVALHTRGKPQRRHDIARGQQHAGDDQFFHRVGIRARRVEYRHAARAHLLHRNIIRPCSGARDRQHAGGNLHLQHVVRTHQDGIGFGDVVARDITLRGQALQTCRRDFVERENVESLSHVGGHDQLLLCANSFIKSTNACTPAKGIAL